MKKYRILASDKKEDFIQLINTAYIGREQEHILDVKIRGLIEGNLSNMEIARCLYHYLHNRGYFYENIEPNKKIKPNTDERFPSIQLQEFNNKYEFYKNSEKTKSFSHKQWLKEVEHFLEKNHLNDNFKKEYLMLFNRIRSFKDGPGNEQTPTKWGRFDPLFKNEQGEFPKTVWEKTIGKCSVYSNEYRAGQKSPVAELFNLINDLNNLTIRSSEYPEKNKLSEKDKRYLLNEAFKNFKGKDDEKNIDLKKIANVLQVNEQDISGGRVNFDNDEFLFTKLDNFNAILSFIKDNNLYKDIDNSDYFNPVLRQHVSNIYEIVRFEYFDKENCKKEIKKFIKTEVTEKSLDTLIKQLKNEINKTHGLSIKAMNEFIDNSGIRNNINSSEYFYTKNKTNLTNNPELHKNSKYLPENLFSNEIISPTAKRALIQSLKVLNTIIKKYGKEYNLSHITIEMARGRNSYEETQITNSNKSKLEDIIKNNKKISNNELEEEFNRLNSKDKLKIKLWYDQDRRDIYTGEYIDYDVLVGDRAAYDVDHILPLSKSGDDSFNNKALTSKENNSIKGDRMPYDWLTGEQWLEFKSRVEDLSNRKNKEKKSTISEEKKKRLLNTEPINTLGFIGRNLSDTRYATTLVLNTLQEFFNVKEHKEFYPNVVVNVIKGQLTNYTRCNILNKIDKSNNFIKDRDEYQHHAIDAAIIAFLGSNHNIQRILSKKLFSEKINKTKYTNINSEENDISEKDNILEMLVNFSKFENLKQFKDSLTNKITSKEIKFSRPITLKDNMTFSDETIYSVSKNTDDEYYTVYAKRINLLQAKNNQLLPFFRPSSDKDIKKLEKLSIYQNGNNNTFNELREIFNFYYDLDKTTNCFIQYMREHFSEKFKLDSEKKYNPKFIILPSGTRISKLKNIDTKKKPKHEILFLNNGNQKSCRASLTALNYRVYQDNNSKIVLVPINIYLLKNDKGKLSIDISKLNELLDKFKVINKNKFIVLNKGFKLRNLENNILFYVSGGTKQSLELKCLDKSNKSYGYRDQIQISISTIIKNYALVEMDTLGNIYKETKLIDFLNDN
ncbi:type II CRISPR RNA-guided endonuclease Cas9 [Ureaplasma ceti]